MPSGPVNSALAVAAKRVPGLRRLPLLRLLALAEIAMLARDHIELLEPAERRRLVALARIGRGRARNLSRRQRRELEELIEKAQPRLFAAAVVERLSPVPLPARLLRGRP